MNGNYKPKEESVSTNETVDVVDGEVLPDLYEPPTTTLFGTSDPKVALERMSDVASVLVDVIKDRRLFARISGHEHITAEGWTTLGGMLGVVPVVVWTRPNETGDGYVARVEARTLDGRVVGAAESECSRGERKWRTADAYAIRSMAQTRAIGRALRAPLGQIVVLAGYEPAGAEEIPASDTAAAVESPPPRTEGTIPDAIKPTTDQLDEIRTLVRTLERIDDTTDWWAKCRELSGVPASLLTRTTAGSLVSRLEEQLAQLT
jgi:hypothetical protein